jgi:hypothetical protein
VANTLAYYDTATITAVKSFIVQALGVSGVSFLDSRRGEGGNKKWKIKESLGRAGIRTK